jgi:photosystem II stability/assembly factor-like uncharacterized protein
MFRRGVRSTAVGILLSAAALALNSVGAMAATSWIPQNQQPHSEALHGVFAIDGCHVWAVGEELAGRSQIINTANGGATWNTVFPPPNSGISTTLNRVAFAGNTGYIVGENDQGSTTSPFPNILKTIDGGVTWTDLRSTLPGGLKNWSSSDFEGLAVIGNTVGAQDVWIAWSGTNSNHYTGDKGEILHSSDGGVTWDIKLTLSGSNTGMAGVAFADATHGWAIRDDGRIYQTITGGASWNQIDNLSFEGNESLEAVAAIDATHVVVVSDYGRAWYLNTAGTAFVQSTGTGSANAFNDVTFNSAGLGYAVGEQGQAYKSTNGGQSFIGESLNNGSNFGGVSIAAGTTFTWVVGANGHISANTPPPACLPPTTTTTTTVPVVIPKLPSAGHPLMPADYNWILLLLIPAIGMLGWLSVKPD